MWSSTCFAVLNILYESIVWFSLLFVSVNHGDSKLPRSKLGDPQWWQYAVHLIIFLCLKELSTSSPYLSIWLHLSIFRFLIWDFETHQCFIMQCILGHDLFRYMLRVDTHIPEFLHWIIEVIIFYILSAIYISPRLASDMTLLTCIFYV